MKSKTTRHGLKRMTALLLAVVLCVGMVPSAFAAQEDNYHDPAEHWIEALNRTNELDANSVVTIETFTCCECGQATSFQVFRVPEYTRNGETALTRNVKYSDGTCLDGESKGDLLDGTPGQDAYYTGYHWTKAVCQTCGTFNTNMGATSYACGKNVYWLYDCAADFFEELPEYDAAMYTHKKMKTNEETSLEILRQILPVMEAMDDFSDEAVHTAMFDLIAKLGVKNGYLLWPLRIALSGKQFTPGGGVEIAAILGKEESLKRLKKGIEKLENR